MLHYCRYSLACSRVSAQVGNRQATRSCVNRLLQQHKLLRLTVYAQTLAQVFTYGSFLWLLPQRWCAVCCAMCCAVCCDAQAKTETVVRISAGKRSDEHTSDSTSDPAANTTSTSAAQAAGTPSTAKNTSSSSSAGSGSSGSSSSSHQEKEPSVSERGVDRIIDSQDNEFVLSAPPKDQVATLTLDPLLIQDLTFLFASAAVSSRGWIYLLEVWYGCQVQLPTDISMQIDRGVVQVELVGKQVVCCAQMQVLASVSCTRTLHDQGFA